MSDNSNNRKNNEIDTQKPANLIEIIFDKCNGIREQFNMDSDGVKEIIKFTANELGEFSRYLWNFYLDVAEKNKDIFQVISHEIFLHVVRHLKRIVNQKIENRNVGVSIVIFSSEYTYKGYGQYFLQMSAGEQKTTVIDVNEFFKDYKNDLQRFYKCIDSEQAFFAYTYNKAEDKLTYDGIMSFGNNKLKDICGCDSIGFTITAGIPCIRIYNSNKCVADYFVSETQGNWLARFKTDIESTLRDAIPNINDKDLENLSNAIMQLSYLGIGSMIIVTSDSNNRAISNSPFPLNREIELQVAISQGDLYHFAAYDGAIIIHKNEHHRLMVQSFGVIINPSSKIPKGYSILLRYTNSGSRHEKAVRYACGHTDDCVVVISENRTISILHGKQPIYWRDNNNPMELVEKLQIRRNYKK
jgi:DNA integrity scanning protein DisA with diadenylate cyclase activity